MQKGFILPTFSKNFESSLHRALTFANERQHEYATLEHLLLSLSEDSDALAVMNACAVDVSVLRADLLEYINENLATLVTLLNEEAKPTAGFQRVVQRAIIHVQTSGREEVTGANALVAIFAERESHAAYFLQKQDMTRFDAVNFISHGIETVFHKLFHGARRSLNNLAGSDLIYKIFWKNFYYGHT